jgi:hypothetical protein
LAAVQAQQVVVQAAVVVLRPALVRAQVVKAMRVVLPILVTQQAAVVVLVK